MYSILDNNIIIYSHKTLFTYLAFIVGQLSFVSLCVAGMGQLSVWPTSQANEQNAASSALLTAAVPLYRVLVNCYPLCNE